MDFCISRVEFYKASDTNGVYREASRNLSKYPHSDVDFSKVKDNVILVEGLRPEFDIVSQIKSIKSSLGIKGRFNVNGLNPKSQTNILGQAFFKLTDGFIGDLTNDDIVNAYSDCLDWFRARFPDIVILSAYVHFDEPNAGPHMHINFLPLARNDKEQLIFSSSKMCPGKDYFIGYQDDLHSWAVENFNHDFARRLPGSEGRKHLSLPEYKKAKDELDEIERKIKAYSPVTLAYDEVENIGTKTLFGGWKVSDEEMSTLKSAANSAIQSSFRINSLERERDDYKKRLEEERQITQNLSKKNREFDTTFEIFKAFLQHNHLTKLFEQFFEWYKQRKIEKFRDKDFER